MGRRVVVVGGGYAGALCAVRLARKTRAHATEIVLVDASPWFVERIRLHEDVAGGGPVRRSLAALLDGTGVRLRIGAVAGIDVARRRAFFDGSESEAFDDLVLATGSVVATGGVYGASRAWTCGTEEHALALRARLADARAERVVIVGAGLTGIELASELASRRPELQVTLVSSTEVALSASTGGRTHVRRVLESMHVELLEDARVVAVEEGAVMLASGEALPSDVTVWCGGFEATSLARNAGLDVDDAGRAAVDARLRSTSHPFVRVIGDAARVEMPSDAGMLQPLRMACATAMPQGAFCADDLAREITGRAAEVFSFGFAGRCVSLGRGDGLVQLTNRRDAAARTWIGGRLGAFIKERVCRYALSSLALERRGLGYSWLRAPALSAAGERSRAMLAERST